MPRHLISYTLAQMSAILILAYRRVENIETILGQLAKRGKHAIYVHIDRGSDSKSEDDAQLLFDKILAYRERMGLNLRISRPSVNQGIAVSMVSSISRVLEDESEVLILEDDCIPSNDFFEYMNESLGHMRENVAIALACGAQFAPEGLLNDGWVLSRYPLNWGWAINRNSWITVSQLLLSKEPLKYCRSGDLTRSEIAYWNAGSRRALEGFTDVWDTLLVRELIRHDLRVLLPSANLVQNNGDEEFATHTRGKQKWTNFLLGTFNKPRIDPEFSNTLDIWLRKKFFRISKRHLISTRITWLIDRTSVRKMRTDLATRVQLAEVNFDL